MSYVLREGINNRYYCYKHDKIIEFDTIDQAKMFLNGFAQAAMSLAVPGMFSGNPGLLGEVQQLVQSTTIDDKPNCECEFIKYTDIFEERTRR